MKYFTLENVIKTVVVCFIAFTLISFVLAAFSDLTLLNRSF